MYFLTRCTIADNGYFAEFLINLAIFNVLSPDFVNVGINISSYNLFIVRRSLLL